MNKLLLFLLALIMVLPLAFAYDVNVFMVAGGGGGGDTVGGGGGAGGYIISPVTYILFNTSYPVVVGAGGLGATGFTDDGNDGQNTTFANLLAYGGGGGRGFTGTVRNGGSGGGNGPDASAGGLGVLGQGNNGGAGNVASNNSGGGGGGASTAGSAGTAVKGGNGGVEINYTIAGVTYSFAGGGGGGFVACGSGGTGGLNAGNGSCGTGVAGTNAVANRGGGGGGGGSTNGDGGNGSSGIVVISYPTYRYNAIGGTISYSGGYTYHTFIANGTFAITEDRLNITVWDFFTNGSLQNFSVVISQNNNTLDYQPYGNLSAWYKLNSNVQTAPDSSGNGNTGTLNGYVFNNLGVSGTPLPYWNSSGKYGYGYSFNGSNQVFTANNISLNLNQGYTLMSWVFINSSSSIAGTGEQSFLYSINLTGTFPYTKIGYRNNSGTERIFFRLQYNSTICDDTRSYTTTSANYSRWIHVAGVYNATSRTNTLYIDGVAVSTGSAYSTACNSVLLQLGNSTKLIKSGGEGTSNNVNGTIDEQRIFNRALNAVEIQTELASSYPVSGDGLVASYSFESNFANSTVNYTYDTNNLVLGQINGSFNYDGIVDYVLLSDRINISNVSSTTAFWFKANDSATGANILGLSTSTTNDFIRITDSGISVEGNINNDRCRSNSISNYRNNAWHHVAIVITQGTCVFYFDGVAIGATDNTIAAQVTVNTIGRSGDGSNIYHNGSIDDIRYVSQNYSSDQVAQIYRGGVYRIYNYSTNTGVVYPNLDGGVYNFTISALQYYSENYTNYNFTTNLAAILQPYYIYNNLFYAKDYYVQNNLTNFSITDQFGNVSSTTTGVINATLYHVYNASRTYNITYSSTENGGYFNQSFLNLNTSATTFANMSQSINVFSATQKVTGATISTANFTSVYLTNVTHYMRAQSYNLTAAAIGYYNRTILYNATGLSSNVYTFAEMYDLIANLSAYDVYTNGSIQNLTVIVSNDQYNFSESQTVTNGLVNVTLLKSLLYNVTLQSTQNGGYFNVTYTNVNLSTSFNRSMSQSINVFSATQKVTGATISTANFTSVYLTNVTHYMRAQSYNLTAAASGYYNRTIVYNATALSSGNYTFTNVANLLANISLRNIVGNSSILSFSVDVSNDQYGFSESCSTSGGTCQLYLSNNVLYNLSFSLTNHTTVTYNNVNLSTNFTGYTYQALLYVTLYDFLSNDSISTFNGTTGSYSNSTTSGVLILHTNIGAFNLTVAAPGYDSRTIAYIINSSGDYYLNYSMTRSMQINIINESSGGLFDINSTSSMVLTIYCPNQTLTYEITTQNQSFVTCQWDYVRLDAFYPSSALFRTLIPAYNSTNFTFVMPDANTVTVYQVNIQLNDLTGQFAGGYATLRKIIGNQTYDIITQDFDAENKIVSYLIRDNFYTLIVVGPTGVQRNIGSIIADTAGTKTVTLPTVLFAPDVLVDGGIISWDWQGNSSLVRLTYVANTSFLTQRIDFTLANASNASQILYSTYSENVSNVTFSYLGSLTQSYIACFTSENSYYGNTDECVLYVGTTPITALNTSEVAFWSDEDESTFWNVVVFVLCAICLFFLSQFSESAALASCAAIMSVFYKFGLFVLVTENATVGVIAIVATMAALVFYLEVNKPQ